MTMLAPVEVSLPTAGDWTIEHYVMCQDPDCFGCPGDEIALCGEVLTGCDWVAPGELNVACIMCEDIHGS